ncbi:MAG: tRNA dihydrouridine(20/20a) synthase DusA [Pseudomonadota bacterium]
MNATDNIPGNACLSVAPMMDWTDRHCRVFHRRLNPDIRLFTEMVTAKAVLFGDQERLLGLSTEEHPVVLQLGGSDPNDLAKASRVAADWGYDEVNLNCGCPSDRVQGGSFGAVLMREPTLVGECLAAMGEGGLPVTLKCRIGVDEQDPEPSLDAVADAAARAGVTFIWVHARKAWLQGLSPAQNRTVPPLDYDRVERLHQRLSPTVSVGLNGGLSDARAIHYACGATDGAMIGRAAYHAQASWSPLRVWMAPPRSLTVSRWRSRWRTTRKTGWPRADGSPMSRGICWDCSTVNLARAIGVERSPKRRDCRTQRRTSSCVP